MKSVYGFVVEPVGDRYNNKKSIGDKQLILNTEIFNHQFVNRVARVVSLPIMSDDLGISVGDLVVVHHNVFRRWHDMKGVERNSKNFFNEKTYIIHEDQIFLYKHKEEWKCPKGYCFVKPLLNKDIFDLEKETPLVGIVKYSDGTVNIDDLIGFRPNSEYEFIIENQKLYRILSKAITIKYEYQGDEEEYNPSWAQSS